MDTAIIIAGCALLASAMTLYRMFRGSGAREEKLKAEVTAARDLAIASTNSANSAIARHELLRDQFQEYKVEMARELAHVAASAEDTARSVIQAEDRLTAAIDGMGERFDKMTERFDQMLLRGTSRRS